MSGFMLRQGDVLVMSIPSLPPGLVPAEPEGDKFVLAHGEVTGHCHSIALSNRIAMFRDDGGGSGAPYLSVSDAPTALEHQEHHEIHAKAAFTLSNGVSVEPGYLPTRTEAQRTVVSLALQEGAPVERRPNMLPIGAHKVVRQRVMMAGMSRRVAD